MTDLLEMLNESIIAAAFERNDITNMRLAERLIWERKSAAARIAELEAALKDAAELLSDAYGDIGRGGYGLGYAAARAALQKGEADYVWDGDKWLYAPWNKVGEKE